MLNSEQEVIDFKLTARGRELLAQGKLKFSFYNFGDAEIDYTFYTDKILPIGETELRKRLPAEAQARILETPIFEAHDMPLGTLDDSSNMAQIQSGSIGVSNNVTTEFNEIHLGGSTTRRVVDLQKGLHSGILFSQHAEVDQVADVELANDLIEFSRDSVAEQVVDIIPHYYDPAGGFVIKVFKRVLGAESSPGAGDTVEQFIRLELNNTVSMANGDIYTLKRVSDTVFRVVYNDVEMIEFELE